MKIFFAASLAVASSASSVAELIQLFGSNATTTTTTTTSTPIEVGNVDELKEYFANLQESPMMAAAALGDVAPEGSVEETIVFFEKLANATTTRIPVRKICFGEDCSTQPETSTTTTTTTTSTTTTTTTSTTTTTTTNMVPSTPSGVVVRRSTVAPPQVMFRGRALTHQQWTEKITVTTTGNGVVHICTHWGCQHYTTSDDEE